MTLYTTLYPTLYWFGRFLLGACAAALCLLIGLPVDAQPVLPTDAQSPDAPPGPGKATQQVEIIAPATGSDGSAERRRSTASRIIIGREEIERQGDSSLAEVLKRLPGVTVGGVPGRGGAPRMRGMGGGYTQILIDGQRMAFGFSLDSISPDQIERIEIIRAPVAETGARAIAGSINVVMREDFKRKANEFKFGGGLEDGRRLQSGGSWLYSGQTDSLGYNLSASGFQQELANDGSTHIANAKADGTPTLVQDLHSLSTDKRSGLFLNSRLQFRLGQGENLDLTPFAHVTRVHTDGVGTLAQSAGGAAAPYTLANWTTQAQTELARLNGSWQFGTASGAKVQLRFGGMLAHSQSNTLRHEFGAGNVTAPLRDKTDNGDTRDSSLSTNGKYSQLLAERHSFSTGYEVEAGRRNDRRTTTEDGIATLTEFGDNLLARTSRLAAYAQDEWDWSKTFSFYAGLRWEAITTQSDSAIAKVDNRSAVLTPLAHAVWRLPDSPRDQVRLSLTRSYRSPNTSQLIARPTISSLAPVGVDRKGGNDPTSADRAGNPNLLPELAWGMDLAFEHYLDAGGLVSANLFVRQIDNLIRTVRSQEVVTWADVPRWVARPQNIGSALSTGIELEAKARASDLITTDLPLSLRANLSLFASKVDQVKGPNNRLDQQPNYTLNLGGDLPLRGTPLTVGGNLNFTPSFVVQQIDNQVFRQGLKRVVDGYALWRFSGDASARLSVANASASDFESGTTTFLADGSSAASDSRNRSYTTVTLRAELRF